MNLNKLKDKTTRKISKRQDIQIYRGIAVLSVILYHLDSEIFSFGYLGVDIFFIISGFVISNLIYSQVTTNSFDLKTFYYQRFKRIFPSLISFIIFVQILIYFFLDHQFIHQTSKANLFSIFFSSNIYFSQITDYFNNSVPRNFVINLWSLSVEEQFYVFFPLLVIFTRKFTNNKKIIIFLFIGLISIAFYRESFFYSNILLKKLFFTQNNFVFYSPVTRAWQFALGILAMFFNQTLIAKDNFKLSERNFTILQIFLIIFITTDLFYLADTLKLAVVVILYTLLLVIEINFKTVNYKILKFILFSGNISYSLYLFHQPIFAAIRNYNLYSNTQFQITLYFENIFNLIIVLIFVYFISFLNFKFVENRYRFIPKFNFKDFQPFIVAFVISISLITLAINTNGYSFREANLKTFNKDTNLEFVPGTNYLAKNNIQCIDKDSLNDSCKFNEKSNKYIYIFGDSVMSSLVSGFVEELYFKDYTIIEYTRGSCPLLINRCNFSMGSNVYKEISNIEDSIVLLGGQYLNSINTENFEQDLIDTIDLLTKNNKVFLFTLFPEPGINVRMYKVINNSFPEIKVKNRNMEARLNTIFKDLKFKNLYLINSNDIFCTDKLCEFYDESSYYYIDHIHFSYYGAKKISQYFINNYSENLKN
tara:strand:+ start:1016 stop:2962 length:1947 start_codon:yes stop_codon:yes gene_type:complete